MAELQTKNLNRVGTDINQPGGNTLNFDSVYGVGIVSKLTDAEIYRNVGNYNRISILNDGKTSSEHLIAGFAYRNDTEIEVYTAPIIVENENDTTYIEYSHFPLTNNANAYVYLVKEVTVLHANAE